MSGIAIASAIGIGLTPGQAFATTCEATNTSQGVNYRGVQRDIGSRVYLEGTSTLSSCGGAGAFAALQEGTGSNDGMIQTGYIKQTSLDHTDCGDGTIGVITEYVPHAGIYHCYVAYPAITFGVGDSFRVEALSDGWQGFFDGTAELPNPVSFTEMGFTSGDAFARGEVGWTSQAYPTFDVTWGPTGQFPAWQFKTNSSGCCTTYTQVDSYANGTQSGTLDEPFNTDEDSDVDWNVGNSSADPPSPFDIQWTG